MLLSIIRQLALLIKHLAGPVNFDKAIAANILSYLMSLFERERTSAEVILYALYLYFLGLSFRNTSKAIQPFEKERGRSHVAIWKWVQRFNPRRLYCCKRVCAFLIDETMVQIGADQAWLWIAVEPIHRQILGVYISKHRNMIIAESFKIFNQDLWNTYCV